MDSSLNKNSFYSLVIFLISPLLAVFVAFKNYSAPWAKNILWLFIIFYAVSFTIPSEGSDAFVYKTQLEEFHSKNIEFKDFISNFYTVEPNKNFDKAFDDVMQPVLTYGVSLFTDDYRYLYLFVGIIFGYFYSRNIWFLINEIKIKLKPVHLIILLSFAMVIPIWNLNSIRMWTAVHVFFYGVINYIYLEKKSRGITFIMLSGLIHFSLFFPVFIFFLFLLAGNRIKVYFFLFCISFFVSELDLGALRTVLLSVVPDFFHRRVETYTPEGMVATVKVRSWIVENSSVISSWSVFSIIIILYIFCKNLISNNKILYKLFAFTLLMLAAGQISSLVPSGTRYLGIGYMFAFATLFLSIQYIYINYTGKTIKPFKDALNIIVPVLIVFCLIAIRIGFDSINIGQFGNVFTLILMGQLDTTIMEMIK